ncbi:hypothetical protein [Nostoc sp.]|uniref:hypothetical protein n=1 Tax=Nostoc sp. TaxID=1180 RepID=UPI002FF7D9C9
MSNNENYKTKYDFTKADVNNVVDTTQSGSQQNYNKLVTESFSMALLGQDC